MLDTKQLHPIVFFITRFFVLAGMVLVFASFGYFVGAYLSKLLFHIDFFSDPQLMNQYLDNNQVLKSIKLLQVTLTIGAMMVPAWMFPNVLGQDKFTFTGFNQQPSIYFLFISLGIIILSAPFISWLIEWNQQIQFPASFAQLEASLKATEAQAQQMTQAFLKGQSPIDLIVNLFIVALIPAIAEELLFRGVLQKFVLFCFHQKHVSIWVAAILFSAFHAQFYGFFPRLILGVFLGYLFAQSGSIWVPIFAHFLNNAISVCIVHFQLDMQWTWLSESYAFPWYIVLLSIAISIGLLWIGNRLQPFNPLSNGE